MPNPNAWVDRIREVAPSGEPSESARLSSAKPAATVRFGGGRSGFLDMSIPESAVWAEVLQSQREANQPAYVEIDPETHYITRLLCPLTVRVGAITPSGDVLQVELIISHARHYLHRGNPYFQEMLDALQAAQKNGTELLVTETLDDHAIIDVRPTAGPKGPRKS